MLAEEFSWLLITGYFSGTAIGTASAQLLHC